MNRNTLIKITNRIAILTVLLLVYWVFIFISITVFDFKIFRENMTEAFYLSILGLFFILSGSMILNIMLNMTKISELIEKREQPVAEMKRSGKYTFWIYAASFPVIFFLLYGGDVSSSLRKRSVLVNICETIVREDQKLLEELSIYKFNKTYIDRASRILGVLEKSDASIPSLSVILPDQIDGKKVFLSFEKIYYEYEDDYPSKKTIPDKYDFILETNDEERQYLNNVFSGKTMDYRFSSHDGNYEIYFPVKVRDRIMILYLFKHDRYGKYGS